MLLAACALGALALAGCNGGAEATPTSVSSATGVNLEVPDMEISIYQGADVLGGETLALSEVVALGQPVVLNFWAALCPPCRAEMPEFQRVYDEREAEVLVLGIDIGHSSSSAHGRRDGHCSPTWGALPGGHDVQ